MGTLPVNNYKQHVLIRWFKLSSREVKKLSSHQEVSKVLHKFSKQQELLICFEGL